MSTEGKYYWIGDIEFLPNGEIMVHTTGCGCCSKEVYVVNTKDERRETSSDVTKAELINELEEILGRLRSSEVVIPAAQSDTVGDTNNVNT